MFELLHKMQELDTEIVAKMPAIKDMRTVEALGRLRVELADVINHMAIICK